MVWFGNDEKQQELVIESAEDRFKISVYYTALDVFIATLCNRFSDFNSLCQKFSCLVDFKNCEENIKCLMDIQLFYGKDVNSSIIDLYKMFCNLLV